MVQGPFLRALIISYAHKKASREQEAFIGTKSSIMKKVLNI
jgi:hypothetical protein